MTLPEAELSFYFAAAAQLEPALRPAFAERVATILQSQADPGPGDVDRAVRQALIGLWVLPPVEEVKRLALESPDAGLRSDQSAHGVGRRAEYVIHARCKRTRRAIGSGAVGSAWSRPRVVRRQHCRIVYRATRSRCKSRDDAVFPAVPTLCRITLVRRSHFRLMIVIAA